MKSQMKLKYTLVFTIISFFITIAGFAQTSKDKEIKSDTEKLTIALKENRLKKEDISKEVSKIQKARIKQYIQSLREQEKQKKESKLTAKSSMKSAESATPQELAQDRAALIAFYNSTNGANWISTQQGKGVWAINDPNAVITSWDPGTNTGWYGITIDASGRVTDISLGRNYLTGTLPSQISGLKSLYSLTADNNSLSGIIPTEISQLQNLRALDLEYNSLTGNIPVQLNQLQNLSLLHLGYNNLSGSIPVELGQLPVLKSLDLDHNPLTGSIPIEILKPNLTFLSLCYDQLSGNIPHEIGNLTNIEYFQVNGNKLTGSIPIEVGNLKKLEWLGLPANELSGTLPAELGQLTSARVLYFDQNKITGPIPPEIKYLSNLESFWANTNLLSGSLPAEFGLLKKVISITVYENNLTGEIPSEIGDMPRLSQFQIGFNKLRGSVPETFRNLSKLSTLSFESNYLSGKIPDLTGLPLSTLRFNQNEFRFVDFSDEHSTYRSKLAYNYSSYNYSRQAFVDTEKNIIVDSGNSVTLTMYEDGRYTPNDTYQWYRGIPDIYTKDTSGELIPGATSRSYTINNMNLKKGGDYYCLSKNPRITNSGYMETNLYLVRNKIHIDVNVICTSTTGTIKTSPENIIANQDFNIFFETTATALTYNWTLYDLDNTTVLLNTTGNNLTTYYKLPGTYKIKLVVTDENGCPTTFEKTVTVVTQICEAVPGTINSGSSNNNYYVNAYADFSFDSSATDLSYLWTVYNQNNTIIEKFYWNNLITSFNVPGTYRINLVVTDANRCTTTINKIITVTQATPCASSETGTIITGENESVYTNTNNEFHFSTNSSQYLYINWTIYNPDNTVFGVYNNDSYFSGLNFSTPGTYRAVVDIIDMSGCTATFTKTFTVTYDCRKYGIIKDVNNVFYNELTPVVASTKVTVFFNSYDPGASGMEFSWSFLNPGGAIIATGSGDNFDVTPTTIGEYKIAVKVTDPATGCVNNFSTILSCVDSCALNDSERNGYITLNGDYGYDNETTFLDLNQTIEVGLYRSWYLETGKTFNLEWSFYSPTGQLISTGNEARFPVTLTTAGGFYKLVVKVTDPVNGCVTEVTKKFTSQMQNGCTQTNERSSEVKELVRNLIKKLLLRTANGETDAQINASAALQELNALKPFITNSPKDKIYNYTTTRNKSNILIGASFSFSPDRESDIRLLFGYGLFTDGYEQEYVLMHINDAVYVDVSQYVSSDEILTSCWIYSQHNRSASKSILDSQDCRNSSEIKNINFCPAFCPVVSGKIKSVKTSVPPSAVAKASKTKTDSRAKK